MSHSLVLGAFLLNLISSQNVVIAATKNQPTIIAHTREVTVFEDKYKKEQAEERRVGYSKKGFCSVALQSKESNPVVNVSGNLVPVNKYCRDFIVAPSNAKAVQPKVAPPTRNMTKGKEVPNEKVYYAVHNGGPTDNSVINIQGTAKWQSPTEFCAKQTKEDCNKPILIKYKEKNAHPDKPTKSVNAYCAGYKKDLGCSVVFYATHNGDITGGGYIKKEGDTTSGGRAKWQKPDAFCAQETKANCKKVVKMMTNNVDEPPKSLGEYCKTKGNKDLGCQ
ncbi:MAG: hypothetical protein WCG04_06685 [Alphaproteobacteria bacterium]